MKYYLGVEEKVESRMLNLMSLEEKRDVALEDFVKHRTVVKRWFDKRDKVKAFRIVDLVLLWDKSREKKGDHSKFDKIWLGPF